MGKTRNEKVDLHVHTKGSIDGAKSIEDLIAMAKGNGLEYLALTDHNTYSEVVKFWNSRDVELSTPMIEVDGVKVIAGTEVTCRVSQITNLSSNSSKLHVLVYGADMSPNSPMAQLLALKRKNDLDCDIGLLRDLLHGKGIFDISEDDIRAFIRERREEKPGFSDLGKKDVWDYLQEHNITIATSYKELCDMIAHLPRYERLNIEFDDLVACARASGGEIVVAHPGVNFDRLSNVNRKLLAGYLSTVVNGFEKLYPRANSGTEKIIQNAINSAKRQKDIAFTGGTDFHDATHGETLGEVRGKNITVNDCENFIENIEKLTRARSHGKLTHRKKVNQPSKEEIDAIIKNYKKRYNQIVTNSQPDVSLTDWERKGRQYGQKKGKKGLTATDRAKLRNDKLIKSGKMPTEYYIEKSKKTEKEKDDEMQM